MSIDQEISQRFVCTKCRGESATVKRIAATGTGLAKMFDIQNNTFITVSCQNCGYTELYNPDILERKSNLGTVLDVLFGG